ncbi:copper chaperone PCu(A)C [Bdellovibrio sp. HCB288]|uniref:copper chaperone PCu(A)C n=1 Tax=Bdellovibrio sp. HCB288 TaxID=3394355 RepID=UPI0039B4CA72
MKSMILSAVMVLVSSAALAADIEISNPHVFVPLKGTNTTAGFGTIKNTSKNEVTVKVVEAKPFKAVELHESSEKNGRMTMSKMEMYKIPAGQTLELKPGGNHIMLFDATKPVEEKQTIAIKLMVNDKEQTVNFPVISRLTKETKKEEKKEEGHHHH